MCRASARFRLHWCTRFCISFSPHFIHFCLEPKTKAKKLQCLQFEISGDTIECKHIILKEYFFFSFRRLSPLDFIRFKFNFFSDVFNFRELFYECIYVCVYVCCIHLVHGELILDITINGKCVDG